MKTPARLIETTSAGDVVLAAAAPMRLGAVAARPGWLPGMGAGATAVEAVEIIRILRMGSIVG